MAGRGLHLELTMPVSVWNRGNPPITVTGDPGLVAIWRDNFKFEWN